jgi:hypothetical protein
MDAVQQGSARSASAARSTSARSHRSLTPIVALVALLVLLSAGRLDAQALALTITKDFSPSVVTLNDTSTGTITVTNPNAVTDFELGTVSNVQFSDTMPAGIQLVTQIGGTCSTLATGGGTFSINPGAGTFSSTSNVLAAGQSCTIAVQVSGTALGDHVNMTSLVTGTGVPSGGPASATLTVLAPTPPTSTPSPTLTATPSPTPTNTASATPTATATPTPTNTASPTPTATASPTPTNTPLPVVAPAVPTLSFPMLVLLGLMIAAAGLFLARRQ